MSNLLTLHYLLNLNSFIQSMSFISLKSAFNFNIRKKSLASMNPQYITPRIAIAKINALQDLEIINKQIELRHKNYYHFFNLTNVKLPQDKQSNFKWRGIPFSISEIFKVLAQIDTFLRINIANTAIICISNPNMEEYARIIIRSYIQICLLSVKGGISQDKKPTLLKLCESTVKTHPYFFTQIHQIYKNISISSPPIKILQSLTILPENSFIPIVQIFTQGRYNDFQLVYYHSIEQELANYYLNLNRPLETGIGKKYYDSKPQTKYFAKPSIVFGDVKIVLYSYKTLKKTYELTFGFNTQNIDHLNNQHKGTIILSNSDLYDRNGSSKDESLTIEMIFSDYCDSSKCKQKSSCNDCKQMIKKLTNRYAQIQPQVQKLHRGRTMQEIQTLLSI